MTGTEIRVPIAAGELFDKITILELKSERIADSGKLANVRRELAALQAVRGSAVVETPELAALVAELKGINEALWDIEDRIRACENAGDFGPDFVALARSVYRTNDERARIKHRINELLGSDLREEKSYAAYR